MSLNVDVSTAVNKLNHKIGFWQPLYEAISNSLEANASEIIVNIIPEDTLLSKENGKVCEISIRDNGDGFTQENIESFGKLWSDHKYDLGCKGIGRLTWLRVFDEVNIQSVAEGKKTTIHFNRKFDASKSLDQKDTKESASWTLVEFKDVSIAFHKTTEKKPENNYDKRGEADAHLIKRLVEENLMAKLFLLKTKDERDFSIKFTVGGEVAEIKSDNLQALHQQDFHINSPLSEEISYDFTLYYAFMSNHQKVSHHNGYCANGRIVTEFGREVKFKQLPDGCASIALLTSKYFDERVNDERNEFSFNINDNNADINNPIPFPKINMEMKGHMQNILAKEFPDLLQKNDDIEAECAKEYPHLQDYFKEDPSLIKNRADLIKFAEKRFKEEKEEAKSSFKRLLKSHDIPPEEYNKVVAKVSDVSAKELAEYIAYRQQIIEALVQLRNDKEKQEKLLHNLFMKMGTESFSPKVSASNIWLLDDKFMSYFYMASDKMISAIYKTFGYDVPEKKDGGDFRPDMFGVYSSNQQDDDESQDIVIIEFKGLGASFSEKRKSISEVWDNTGVVKDTYPNVRTIWSFIITDIDEKFEGTLKRNMFKPYYSSEEGSIYHSYNDELDVHCYAISIGALLTDANSRNSVFLDIITRTPSKANIPLKAVS